MFGTRTEGRTERGVGRVGRGKREEAEISKRELPFAAFYFCVV